MKEKKSIKKHEPPQTNGFNPDMAINTKTGFAGYRDGQPVFIHDNGDLLNEPKIKPKDDKQENKK